MTLNCYNGQTKSLRIRLHKWIDFVNKNCRKSDETHKYEMSLPLKNNVDMPDNSSQVYNRLMSSKKKLLDDDKLREEYSDFMKIMRDRAFVEEVPEEEINPNHRRVWFPNHHAVRHKKKGKLRIVFDSFLEFNGVSLNNTLWKGPDLINSVVGVLMRFRENMFAVSGDIDKLYYQVEVGT